MEPNDRIESVWAYAREAGCLYNGWASPPGTKKMHYFKEAKSVCGYGIHFGRPQPDIDLNYVPNHPFIKTCKICLKKYNEMKKDYETH